MNKQNIIKIPLILITLSFSRCAPPEADFARLPNEHETHVFEVTLQAWLDKGVKYGHTFCENDFHDLVVYGAPEEEMPDVCEQDLPGELIAGCYVPGSYDKRLLVYNTDHVFYASEPLDSENRTKDRLFVHEYLHLLGFCSQVAHYSHTNPLVWSGAETETSGISVQRLAEERLGLR